MAGLASRILGCSSKYEADPRDHRAKVSPSTTTDHLLPCLLASTQNNSWHSLTVNETLPSPSLFLFAGVGGYLSIIINHHLILYQVTVGVRFIYFSFETVFFFNLQLLLTLNLSFASESFNLLDVRC